MTLEEYSARMAEELKKLDWRDADNKESGARQLLKKASADRQLPTEEWMKLYDQYRKGVQQA